MKKIVKVLRLASFSGNIGDVANRLGAENLFKKNLDFEFKFHNIEIRDYFRLKKFDKDFLNLVNSFDLFFVGGGGYLETWVSKNKSSSTTLDFNNEILNGIKIPIVFYALGVNTWQKFSNDSKKRFKKFLEKIIVKKNIFFSIRNDGSFYQLKNILNKNLLKKVHKIADGGFFIDSHNKKAKSKKEKDCLLGINIAGDLFKFRFENKKKYKDYLKQLNYFFINFLATNKKYKIIFIIHVWHDYQIMNDLFMVLPEEIRRHRVRVSQFNPSKDGYNDFIKTINSCDVIISNRFHSNITSLISKVPTIGLVNFPQVFYLYKELNLQKLTVNTINNNLSKNLSKKVLFLLNNKKKIINLQNKEIEKVKKYSILEIKKLNAWLKVFF